MTPVDVDTALDQLGSQHIDVLALIGGNGTPPELAEQGPQAVTGSYAWLAPLINPLESSASPSLTNEGAIMTISRRNFMAAVGGTMALSACGTPTQAQSGNNAGTAGGGAVNVILSNHPWQRGITPLFPDFTKATGITVNVQTFAEQQARDKILLTMQSKSDSMDIFMTLPSREGAQFSTANYYQALDDYVSKAASDYRVDDFTKGTMAAMRQSGKLVALPINVEGPTLYYRTDIFSQLGLKPPATVEELFSVCKVIKSNGGGIVPITIRGAALALNYCFAPFFHGEGLEWTTDGVPNFDKPGAARAIENYAGLARDYGPPGVVNYSFTESTNLFAQGKAAMEFEATNELRPIIDPTNSTVSDKVGVVKVPAGSVKAAPTVLSWGIAMSPFAANKSNAWQFMQWATSASVQLKLATDAQIAPPRLSVTKDPAYTAMLKTDTQKQWQVALDDLQANGNSEIGPVGVQASQMRQVIGDGVDSVILGKATAEQAAQTIQTGLIPLLKQI